MTTRPKNDYDEIKGLLNKVRKIQAMSAASKEEQLLREQMNEPDGNEAPPTEEKSPDPSQGYSDYTTNEKEDIAVINGIDVEVHSEDSEDLELKDEEKTKISQLIDDFRMEVSEIAEFDKLHIYETSAKLDGRFTDIDIAFSFSTGDDTGLYISNASMLKIDDRSLAMINKLKAFEQKYINSINDLLVNRSTT